jgi:hypothetical protein
VRIVFCGGCNPVIDRVALADELAADPDLAGLDVEIDISGCSRSCAAGQALVAARPDVVVVAGRHVDGTLLEPGELAAAVKRRLSTPKE